MALVLAVVVFVVTLVVCGLIMFADGLSDAPSVQGTPVWPAFITGTTISVLLGLSHWFLIPC